MYKTLYKTVLKLTAVADMAPILCVQTSLFLFPTPQVGK